RGCLVYRSVAVKPLPPISVPFGESSHHVASASMPNGCQMRSDKYVASGRPSLFITASAAPRCCEICASSSRRRSDVGSVYVSFQRTPDAIMRTSRSGTPSYAVPRSAGTQCVTESERLRMYPCLSAAPTSVDVIDFATDIDIQRVRGVLPNR